MRPLTSIRVGLLLIWVGIVSAILEAGREAGEISAYLRARKYPPCKVCGWAGGDVQCQQVGGECPPA